MYILDDIQFNMRTHLVYGLSLDGVAHRYVGMTSVGLQVRRTKHLYAAARGGDLPVHRWIRKHGAENIMISELDRADSRDDLSRLEVEWITRLQSSGFNLLNLTAGGSGMPQRYGWKLPGPKPRSRCLTCKLPENLLGQIHSTKGVVSYPTMSKWLVHEGHAVSSSSIGNHFRANHHTIRSTNDTV